MNENDRDHQAIQELINRQFASMSWTRGGMPDLHAFANDFLATASLYPSARPLSVQTVDKFGSRMSDLARSSLSSFVERVLGTKVHVFGNVAIAAVACENIENDTILNRNVEMMLLVKDAGQWKIAAQGWDRENESRAVPSDLIFAQGAALRST